MSVPCRATREAVWEHEDRDGKFRGCPWCGRPGIMHPPEDYDPQPDELPVPVHPGSTV